MAASTRNVSGGAETYFAKKLASNEKTVRDEAVKKLRTWISTRRTVSSGLAESDMLKLWKGLFYCMWMSDKPKVQEELAESIAQLIHSFQLTSAAVDYLDGFYKTICREWHGIDRLRLDKFYLLIRKFIYQSIVFLKNHAWKNEAVVKLNRMLENGPLSSSNDSLLVPDGVKIHVIQVYLEEIWKCDYRQIPSSVFLQLLEPFIRLLATSRSKVITKTVSKDIFDELLQKVLEDQKHGCLLKVDFKSLSDQFFSWASRQEISARNRLTLYKYVDRFKITSKENDCGKSLHQIDENGVDKSTDTLKGNCDGTVEATDQISMNIDEGKNCKTHAKRMRENEKREEIDVVEGVVNLSTSSTVENDKKKKGSKKKETSNQDCTKVDNDNTVSVEESIALSEDSVTKGRHDKPFVSECAQKNKTAKKLKGRKRKVKSKTGSGENISALNGNVESIKKRKLDKLDQNKISEDAHVGDTVDKLGKKKEKKKLKNKSLVAVQDSNDKLPMENKSDVTSELSTIADASRNEESEIMDNTSDSLDGSYLSTLPKQAQSVNVLEATKTTKIVKKDKSPVHDANNILIANIKDARRSNSSLDSLCQSTTVMTGDKIANVTEEENETVSVQDVNLTPDSMPLAMFVRHSQKKVITGSRSKKEKKNSDAGNLKKSTSGKKKVRIELSKNTSHTTRDYRHSLKSSPVVPFDAKKKPVQSSLKTPPASASKAMLGSLQPQKRPTAVDFF